MCFVPVEHSTVISDKLQFNAVRVVFDGAIIEQSPSCNTDVLFTVEELRCGTSSMTFFLEITRSPKELLETRERSVSGISTDRPFSCR